MCVFWDKFIKEKEALSIYKHICYSKKTKKTFVTQVIFTYNSKVADIPDMTRTSNTSYISVTHNTNHGTTVKYKYVHNTSKCSRLNNNHYNRYDVPIT